MKLRPEGSETGDMAQVAGDKKKKKKKKAGFASSESEISREDMRNTHSGTWRPGPPVGLRS